MTAVKTAKAGIVVFPGSNCDHDTFQAIRDHYSSQFEPEYIWHKNAFNPKDYGLIIIPGGFSYGDYLRSGAMARFSRAMDSVAEYAQEGRPIFGICNGFQILCEAHLLPGALTRNRDLKHIARFTKVKRVNRTSPYTADVPDRVLALPVSHSEGAFFIDADGLKKLQDNDQIAFRYEENINGSVDDIAGILSADGRILGMMPHPERALQYPGFISQDGKTIFDSLVSRIL